MYPAESYACELAMSKHIEKQEKRLISWRDEIRMCHHEDCVCRICGDEPLDKLLDA
jgi:hypothetical protein